MEWLLWIDLETTGLDSETCCILQVGCVLSDMHAQLLYELPEYNINCSQSHLNGMNEWCKTTHAKSGLIDKVSQSTLNLHEVETNIIMLLNEHVALTHKVYIAGNSVHFDKAFIKKYMPKLYGRFHHRNLDVSAVSLFLKTKGVEIKYALVKAYRHTALADIRESMDEYKGYLKN